MGNEGSKSNGSCYEDTTENGVSVTAKTTGPTVAAKIHTKTTGPAVGAKIHVDVNVEKCGAIAATKAGKVGVKKVAVKGAQKATVRAVGSATAHAATLSGGRRAAVVATETVGLNAARGVAAGTKLVKLSNVTGWAAMAGEVGGKYIAKEIAEAAGADEYEAAQAAQAGKWTGSIGAGASTGAFLGGPVGAAVGAGTAAGMTGAGQIVEYTVDSVRHSSGLGGESYSANVNIGTGDSIKFACGSDMHKAGLIEVKVDNSSSIMYKYAIRAKTYKKCHLEFTCGEPDTYDLRCQAPGWHVVRYNSEKHRIQKITLQVL